jgi:hypothetical protein
MSDPEKKRRAAEYYAAHRSEIRRKTMDYYWAHHDAARLRAAKYYKAHRQEKIRTDAAYYQIHRKTKARYNLNLKRRVFALYGPQQRIQCSWSECMVVDLDMLTLDHINDDGRRREHGSGNPFYTWLLKEAAAGKMHEIQVLCCNHNTKKQILRLRRTHGQGPVS